MEAVKSSPKDAQVMAAILKDMNVADYESRVVNHMLEFTYSMCIQYYGIQGTPIFAQFPSRQQ